MKINIGHEARNYKHLMPQTSQIEWATQQSKFMKRKQNAKANEKATRATATRQAHVED